MAKFTKQEVEIMTDTILENISDHHKSQHDAMISSDEYQNFNDNFSKTDDGKALRTAAEEMAKYHKISRTIINDQGSTDYDHTSLNNYLRNDGPDRYDQMVDEIRNLKFPRNYPNNSKIRIIVKSEIITSSLKDPSDVIDTVTKKVAIKFGYLPVEDTYEQ